MLQHLHNTDNDKSYCIDELDTPRLHHIADNDYISIKMANNFKLLGRDIVSQKYFYIE